MPRRIPTLGYRSRKDAVLALREQGVPDDQIAAAVGLDKAVIWRIASAARFTQCRHAVAGRTVLVAADVLDALQADADARGLSVNALARLLLEQIAEDKLVGAILDDGGGEHA